MSTNCLFCGKMVDICLGYSEAALFSGPAADAFAAFFYRREIGRIRMVAEIICSIAGYSISETLGSCVSWDCLEEVSLLS